MFQVASRVRAKQRWIQWVGTKHGDGRALAAVSGNMFACMYLVSRLENLCIYIRLFPYLYIVESTVAKTPSSVLRRGVKYVLHIHPVALERGIRSHTRAWSRHRSTH